jgi:HAD superfamily hydrolase (TIGR01490 family)
LKTYAFFDLDNTLIKPVSLVSFFIFLTKNGLFGPRQLAQFERIKMLKAAGIDRLQLNREYYAIYQGLSFSSLMEMGEKWFEAHNSPDFFNPKVCQRVAMHREKGHRTCIVSGSFFPCIRPIQRKLGIEQQICTELMLAEGYLTGRVSRYAIGTHKKERMDAFIEAENVSSDNCYAYADDISDLEMLTTVGHPIAVTPPGSTLHKLASKNKWHIISPADTQNDANVKV